MSLSLDASWIDEFLHEDIDLDRVDRIVCLGSGYVGASLGAVLASKLPNLINVVDRNADRINAWNSEHLPLSEPGLDDIVKARRNTGSDCASNLTECTAIDTEDIPAPNGNTSLEGGSQICDDRNLSFTTDIPEAIDEADFIFICVNTPGRGGMREVAALDISDVQTATMAIAKHSTRDKVIVVKSTVPCGTTNLIQSTLNRHAADGVHLEVLSNPEFLAEGRAIEDILHPDRIIIGSRSDFEGKYAAEALANLYTAWVPRNRIIFMDTISAELSKLASNALLAQRISAANALSALCEEVGADLEQVTEACGLDHRIGPYMLKAGPGLGGGCLVKDVSALAYLAGSHRLYRVADFWRETLKMNDYQSCRIKETILRCLDGDLDQKRIAVLGFAYKKDTKDCRNSPAVELAYNLMVAAATVAVYDPQVCRDHIMSALGLLDPKLLYEVCESAYEACTDAAMVVLVTDWDDFGDLDWKRVASAMREPKLVYDARNVLDREELEAAGLRVEAVGKAPSSHRPKFRQIW